MTKAKRDRVLELTTAIIDTREQAPLDLLLPNAVEMGLCTGDYSVVGLENLIRIERKSIADLAMCCGRERERFERCIERLRTFKLGMLVIEGSESTVELKQYMGEMHPNAILNSVYSWQSAGIFVDWAGDRQRAARHISRTLYFFAKKNLSLLETHYKRYALKEGSYESLDGYGQSWKTGGVEETRIGQVGS
jgi:DNA excision repair protein ERCC-4